MNSTAPAPTLTVAQLLLEYLKLEGVSKIFGIPGGACIYVMNELKQQQDKFQFVICRQETGAVYIAHGYSAVTDGLGVVLTTSGPAASNALTGAINAHTSCVPVLVITGEVPQKFYGRAYLQEGIDARLDMVAVFENAVQYSVVITTPDNFATLFQQALRETRSLPGRATHVSLPNDLAALPSGSTVPPSVESFRAVPGGTDAAKVGLTFDDLTHADWPLIFLGNGSRRALRDRSRRAAFTAFVERFGIPVMTTPDGKGIFPESHPLSLRNYGLCGSAWTSMYMGQRENLGSGPGPYDVLLVLGSNLGELATSVYEKALYSKMLIPTRSFTHVDLDQSAIGRDFPVTRGIVAEVGATIDLLCHLGDERRHAGPIGNRMAVIAEMKRKYPACDRLDWLNSEQAPVNPAALMRVLNEEIRQGHVFIDCGNCVGWSLNYLVVDPPLSYQSALAMGPMGFAVGAVIGAKLGSPNEACVAICGDGAFMMHGAEISTAAQNRIGAIWVVLNDNDLSMVSQGMAALFHSDSWNGYYKLGSPDLVMFSESLGAHAVAINPDQNPEAFRAALRDALRRSQGGEPQAIIVHIDTTPSPPYGWPKLS